MLQQNILELAKQINVKAFALPARDADENVKTNRDRISTEPATTDQKHYRKIQHRDIKSNSHQLSVFR
ncbi:hypothetical protein [Dendronalium sp. ChiSLP03b]|uniref:hypothetical protein n=1 Tax=Dendronalium sp. ChiSLP03b TaxID=3075381 RepID=UPI002AD2F5BE|nr:hypothetical protein [Dendronalium sp. ChiSLP03b]MDZ8204998.1 hypothetical protein [Dendronalium sp. ChiSLP03b]